MTTAATMALVLLVCALRDSVATAFQIGPAEHFEVTKAFLVSKGYKLYDQIWNDQPPLHTLLLAFLFHSFGPTITVARTLAVVFALFLFIGFFVVIKKENGYCAAGVATFCFLSAPHVLNLSVSAMLEVPAWALGLWSLWPLQQRDKSVDLRSIVASAVLFAIALQIKLTAGLLAPALCAEIVVTARHNGSRLNFSALYYTFAWIASVSITFLVLGFCFGSGYGQAWTSHFSSQARESIEMQGYALSLNVFLEHKEALCGTAVLLGAIAFLKKRSGLLFPLVLLATVTFVHLLHRPWWPYYYLHFAMPLSWLSGCSVVALQRLAADPFVNSRCNRLLLFDRPGILISVGLFMLFAIYGGERLQSEIESIRNQPRIQDNNLVAKMKKAAARTQWTYTPATMYAFHAGLAVPPELAVVVSKRFWCGQITEKNISDLVIKYQPQQLLLPVGLEHSENYAFVPVKYRLVCEDEGYRLFFDCELLTNSTSPSRQ